MPTKAGRVDGLFDFDSNDLRLRLAARFNYSMTVIPHEDTDNGK